MNSIFFGMICLMVLFPAWSFADSVLCDGGIVSNGDTAVDLIMKCGQPDWKDSRTEEVIDRLSKDTKRTTLLTADEWTYNFGESLFLRIVTIRNGVITGIRSGQRGAAGERDPPGPACDDRAISVGDRKPDILIKCGEPHFKNSFQEEIRERFGDSSVRTVVVTVEEWTYNFGPQRFIRVITFRNGTVVEIRTGGYGR